MTRTHAETLRTQSLQKKGDGTSACLFTKFRWKAFLKISPGWLCGIQVKNVEKLKGCKVLKRTPASLPRRGSVIETGLMLSSVFSESRRESHAPFFQYIRRNQLCLERFK